MGDACNRLQGSRDLDLSQGVRCSTASIVRTTACRGTGRKEGERNAFDDMALSIYKSTNYRAR